MATSSPSRRKRTKVQPGLFVTAIALADGQTYGFYEFFDDLIPRLDIASGDAIRFLKIGHPGKSGPVHKRLRSDEHVSQDEADSAAFAQKVSDCGGDAKFVISQELELALKEFEIPRNLLPAILFLVPSPGCDSPDREVLSIPLASFSTNARKIQLGNLLCACFSSETVQRKVTNAGRINSLIQNQQWRTLIQDAQAAITNLGNQAAVPRTASTETKVFAWVVSESGKQSVTETEYAALIGNKATHGIVVNQVSGQVWKNGKEILPLPGKAVNVLTEAALQKYAFSANRLPSLEGHVDPNQAFRAARRLIDCQVTEKGQKRWRIFKTASSRGEPTKYRFSPDDGLKIVFISLAS